MRLVDKKSVFSGFYEVFSIKLENESTKKIIEREQFKMYDSVAALVWNSKKEVVILVKQFRVGAEKEILEIPAGKRDVEAELPELTAKREIEEEIGYQTDKITEITSFYTTPGPVTERMTLYFAEVSNQTSKGGGVADEDENITVVEMEANTFKNYQFEDAKTIIAQQWFQIHH